MSTAPSARSPPSRRASSRLLKGMERADLIAFDFHKWGQVPYSAGFLLTRDGEMQKRTFASANAYLTRAARGLAAGELLALRLRPRSLARLSGAENLVHLKSVRNRGARPRHRAHLRSRVLSRATPERRRPVRGQGAGDAEHRLLRPARRKRRAAQPRPRRRASPFRRRRPVPDHCERRAGHPLRARQSPHPPRGHRRLCRVWRAPWHFALQHDHRALDRSARIR